MSLVNKTELPSVKPNEINLILHALASLAFEFFTRDAFVPYGCEWEYLGKCWLNCIQASLGSAGESSQTFNPTSNYPLSVAVTHGNVLLTIKSRSSRGEHRLALSRRAARFSRPRDAALSETWAKFTGWGGGGENAEQPPWVNPKARKTKRKHSWMKLKALNGAGAAGAV